MHYHNYKKIIKTDKRVFYLSLMSKRVDKSKIELLHKKCYREEE